jgi:hypothetical protein
MPQPENGPPNKRVKSGPQITHQFAFTNAHDIKQALRTTQDPNVLSKGPWLAYVYDHCLVPQPLVQPYLRCDQSYL